MVRNSLRPSIDRNLGRSASRINEGKFLYSRSHWKGTQRQMKAENPFALEQNTAYHLNASRQILIC
jgi:hypothetical protein